MTPPPAEAGTAAVEVERAVEAASRPPESSAAAEDPEGAVATVPVAEAGPADRGAAEAAAWLAGRTRITTPDSSLIGRALLVIRWSQRLLSGWSSWPRS